MRTAPILVVDDDHAVREVMTYALGQAGYPVIEAKDGDEALALWKEHQPRLIVMDIGLPERDGLSVCRHIRATAHTPVIFVSSRDEELDKLLGLEMGGDDYMTKPFSPRELVARTKAVLRRMDIKPASEEPSEIKHGGLTLNLKSYQASWNHEQIVLTTTEFSILKTLCSDTAKVFSRQELVEGVYGHAIVVSDRTVDSHIRRVRKKLTLAGCASVIRTHHGFGYQIEAL